MVCSALIHEQELVERLEAALQYKIEEFESQIDEELQASWRPCSSYTISTSAMPGYTAQALVRRYQDAGWTVILADQGMTFS